MAPVSALAILLLLTPSVAFFSHIAPPHTLVGGAFDTSRALSTTSASSSPLKALTNVDDNGSLSTRRGFISASSLGAFSTLVSAPILGAVLVPLPTSAVGPVKVPLQVVSYTAAPCPKDRPIPGEKAMKGMRGLCVTVKADVTEVRRIK